MSYLQESVDFRPYHPNANIHGVVAKDGSALCRTGNGGICTGCCEALHVVEGRFDKEEGTPCPEQTPARGCKFLLEGRSGRYGICYSYHCSSDFAKLQNPQTPQNQRVESSFRLATENMACLKNEEIDASAYRANLERIPSP